MISTTKNQPKIPHDLLTLLKKLKHKAQEQFQSDSLNEFQKKINHSDDKLRDSLNELAILATNETNEKDSAKKLHHIKKHLLPHDFNSTLKNGDTYLTLACKNNSIKTVKSLLKSDKIDVNKPNSKGFTPLYAAIDSGNSNIVKLLLNRPEINPSKIVHGTDVLHLALSKNNIDKEVLELLLNHPNTNVNQTDTDGLSPLHSICLSERGNIGVITQLLKSDININQPTQRGYTALDLAILSGNKNVLNSLISHKNTEVNKVNHQGFTPLQLSVMRGNAEAVSALLQHKKIDINLADRNGNTPLITACKCNNSLIAYYLIAHGADVNQKNYNNESPLSIAMNQQNETMVSLLCSSPKLMSPSSQTAEPEAKKFTTNLQKAFNIIKKPFKTKELKKFQQELKESSTEKHIEKLIELIRNKDIDKDLKGKLESLKKYLPENAITNCIVDKKHSLLTLACKYQNKEIVKFLLKNYEIDVNTLNPEGFTPLYVAANAHNPDIVESLLKQPEIQPNKLSNGCSAFYLACCDGDTKTARLLAQHPDTDINLSDADGFTPLHAASNQNNRKVVEFLLSHKKIIIPQESNYGNTVLHTACAAGNKEIVELLLSHSKIEPNQLNNNGKTAASIATDKNFTDIVTLLKNSKKIDFNINDTNSETIVKTPHSQEKQTHGPKKHVLFNSLTEIHNSKNDDNDYFYDLQPQPQYYYSMPNLGNITYYYPHEAHQHIAFIVS